jgi:ribonuclease Z
MSFSVTVIGSNSAIPAHGRHPSCQVLNINDKMYMIDCGEGTQMRFHEFGIKWMKINHIFISHLHGDHYFGLIGLVSTYNLLKRNRPLYLYAPAALMDILHQQLLAGQTTLGYEIIFRALDPAKNETIFEGEDIIVETIVLKHRIECLGFIFKEKPRERKINKEKFHALDIPVELIPEIKKGMDVLDEKTGERILNKDITIDPLRPRAYAYCCDTAFNPEMAAQIKGVDLLYHDCTFDAAGEQRAADTYHSTTLQAAQMASLAAVNKLMIGHFSSKYDDLRPLLDEAKTVFENSILAIEGRTILIER